MIADYDWAEHELYRVAFSEKGEAFENADNFRVARVDNADEMRTFEVASDRGCCGSHEWEATDPTGQRWKLGFNYGH